MEGEGASARSGYPSSPSSAAPHPNPNPFREAEKKYQLHYDQVMAFSKGKLRGKGEFRERPTDLSEVLDFRSAEPPPGAAALETEAVPSAAAARGLYTLDGHPGFYFVSGLLDESAVEDLAGEILSEHIEPPATSNFTREHGTRIRGLWGAARRGLFYRPGAGGGAGGELPAGGQGCWSAADHPAASQTPAQVLLDRLRWVSLGPQYDWTRRVYRDDVPCRGLPRRLKELADALVRDLRGASGRVQASGGYSADAALLNFYGSKDTLGGHKDDAELDLSQPLVSVSLGCDAVFLLGGTTKGVRPTAMLVRSGDVVVLSGRSRSCFHGVPRIFSKTPRRGGVAGGGKRSPSPSPSLRGYLDEHRINVSVRMVGRGAAGGGGGGEEDGGAGVGA
ncbi:alpha-ketoglutarate-dependent dioxygenase AlkB [Chloropicon primus]|uniref:Alpha-ketoglutarate-dependent dioxygenase AlkB n=2 Tax=Chloropicon primus TaxID=1764295 RepID=A0A5B8MEH5_9CHLO|nr:alpha-ketoglutarate-dependent dioxygenase AlkB [Chloropicon primus]UPQ98225.1 alpha-ketoglutarate-dependent dioxygenase AlkB [Chloropicon primus]|eukprot:QDZ19016.1 alpha-ketoglutarate-dependent dioxygenase AlkB [Chloropicon primus]